MLLPLFSTITLKSFQSGCCSDSQPYHPQLFHPRYRAWPFCLLNFMRLLSAQSTHFWRSCWLKFLAFIVSVIPFNKTPSENLLRLYFLSSSRSLMKVHQYWIHVSWLKQLSLVEHDLSLVNLCVLFLRTVISPVCLKINFQWIQSLIFLVFKVSLPALGFPSSPLR